MSWIQFRYLQRFSESLRLQSIPLLHATLLWSATQTCFTVRHSRETLSRALGQIIPAQPQSGMAHLHPGLTSHLQHSALQATVFIVYPPVSNFTSSFGCNTFSIFQSMTSQQSIPTLFQPHCSRLPLQHPMSYIPDRDCPPQ